jgi:hypothetical protein
VAILVGAGGLSILRARSRRERRASRRGERGPVVQATSGAGRMAPRLSTDEAVSS